jgi:hypothetical protein
MPSVDECRDRLHRAGWSMGETGNGSMWQVDGSNGPHRILAAGRTQAEAWQSAHRHNCPSSRNKPPRAEDKLRGASRLSQ